MTTDDLLDAIGEIDDSHIASSEEKPRRRKIVWTGVGSLAACLILFLFLPNGLLNRLAWNREATDYAPKDYTRFSVYYADGETLSSFTYEICGGYEEMFFAWKNQNGIGEEVLLIDFALLPFSDTAGSESQYVFCITVSSAFSDYLEKADKGLLMESLKKTVASYTGNEIKDIELILSD